MKKRKSIRKTEIINGNSHLPVNIVGIGASAGGLDAFRKFFMEMPSTSGLAFVIVTHLDPDHKSIIDELFIKTTQMHIAQVVDGMKIVPNSIFFIPPNKNTTVLNGRFQLLDPVQKRNAKYPINFFFVSLSRELKGKAVGIILSGAGTDGTEGIKAIKNEGGMVMVQDSKTAKYDGMPKSAIASGSADYILPIEKMPQQLLKHIVQMDESRKKREKKLLPEPADTLHKIFVIIRNRTGYDFSHYKKGTIMRRIRRRMSVTNKKRLLDYFNLLRREPAEIDALYREFLIKVTSFFRDIEAFETLKKKVLPYLFSDKKKDTPVRIWAPGCCTGEEAYSLAMIATEYMEETGRTFNVQIFATDVDAEVIETARIGVYPKTIISNDVSPKRLKRFFVKSPKGYRMKYEIRDMVVFAIQDLLNNPPLHKLDLISCRNLLIYLDQKLHRKLLQIFHYSLNPGGILFLGMAESVGKFTNLFSVFDKKTKFFERNVKMPLATVFTDFPISELSAALPVGTDVKKVKESGQIYLSDLTSKALLNNYAPPCAIINMQGGILYTHGRVDRYLKQSVIDYGLSIVDIASNTLKMKLKESIKKIAAGKKNVVYESFAVKIEGDVQIINLVVKSIREIYDNQKLMMVIFEEVSVLKKLKSMKTSARMTKKADMYVASLEQELRKSKRDLRITIEEMESLNEELKSINEELRATNDELFGTNEELEVAKEEMQSSNEELISVNVELEKTNTELRHANDDMINLMKGVFIPIVILGNDARIRRYNSIAGNILGLTIDDIGRKINCISPVIKTDNLGKFVGNVINTKKYKDREVMSKAGLWYSMQVAPYLTVEGDIGGAVLSLVDIHALKNSLRLVEAARNYAEGIVETVKEPLVILDVNLKIVTANKSFYKTFKVTKKSTENKYIYKLGTGQWNVPRLKKLFADVIKKDSELEDFEAERIFPKIGRRIMLLNARQIYSERITNTKLILLSIMDITGRKQAEEVLLRDKKTFEKLVKERTQELLLTQKELDRTKRLSDIGALSSIVAHELRNPLATIDAALYNIKRKNRNKSLEKHMANINKKIQESNQIIDNLLSYSRLKMPEYQDIKIVDLIEDCIMSVETSFTVTMEKVKVTRKIRIPSDTVLQADPLQVRVLLVNILNNACESLPKTGGSVNIDTSCSMKQYLCVSITDNGCGIDRDYLKKVTEPFFTTRSRGTGLGLTVCKQIIDLHNGILTIKNRKGKEKGVAVIIKFPWKKQAE